MQTRSSACRPNHGQRRPFTSDNCRTAASPRRNLQTVTKAVAGSSPEHNTSKQQNSCSITSPLPVVAAAAAVALLWPASGAYALPEAQLQQIKQTIDKDFQQGQVGPGQFQLLGVVGSSAGVCLSTVQQAALERVHLQPCTADLAMQPVAVQTTATCATAASQCRACSAAVNTLHTCTSAHSLPVSLHLTEHLSCAAHACPSQYYVTGNLTKYMYAPDCRFKDPTTDVKGAHVCQHQTQHPPAQTQARWSFAATALNVTAVSKQLSFSK